MTKKDASTAFGMLIGLWIANIVIAVVAAIFGAFFVLIAPGIAFWIVWVSAYVTLIILHRAQVVSTLWRMMAV